MVRDAERPDLAVAAPPIAPFAPLKLPALIVFISNTCLMVLELVAGRLISPYMGNSLYTWTSIIGVVLAGITVGNYLGGWLADRQASRRLLGAIFLACAVASLLVLPINSWMADNRPLVGVAVQMRIVAVTGAIFLPVSILLGLISPMVVKLSLASLDKTGNVVGQVYAAGAAGSILGTFATGFVLVSLFGTHRIVIGVAAILALTGLVVGGWWRRPPAMALTALLAAGTLLGVNQAGLMDAPCLRESNYFCIKIRDRDQEGTRLRALVLDRLVHSYVNMDDPASLLHGYGYETTYSEVLAQWMGAHRIESPDTLFIGGGGYTFPRYIEATFPAGAIDVVEIDPAVTEVVIEHLALNPAGRIRTANADARAFFNGLPDGDRYHFIFGDAFNDFSVPYHLTTREFAADIRAHLTDDGLYMANIIDGPDGAFLRAFVHTLRAEFPHVGVIPSISGWRTAPRSTYVLLASREPLDGLQGSITNMLPPAELEAFLAERPPLVLTDDFAPVDNLLAPVYLEFGF